MRTLLFCTSHNTTQDDWQERHRLWINAVRRAGIAHDALLIVDDGSPVLPAWADAAITHLDLPDRRPATRAPIALHHFSHSLGRSPDSHYPGWYRSFGHALTHARAHGFQRVIHVESDAAVISPRFAHHLSTHASGWASVWCPLHKFPELAIQAIAPDALDAAHAWFARPYAALSGRVHERYVPFTQVDRHFIGDRYGEHHITAPPDADFAAQLRPGSPDETTWWLTPNDLRAIPRIALNLRIHHRGPGIAHLRHGWSGPEPDGIWTDGPTASLTLPPIPRAPRPRLQLHLNPYIHQRLALTLNGSNLGQHSIAGPTILDLNLRPNALNPDAPNTLALTLPDNTPGPDTDTRHLGIRLRQVTIRVARQG